MNYPINKNWQIRILASLVLIFGLLFQNMASAASINLATSPLANSTTTNVLPNLMFTLDNSGSMDWDYLPDWANDRYCKGNSSSSLGTANYCCRDSSNSGSGSNSCYPNYISSKRGMPPFHSADFNKVYYDPSITYPAPINYDGSSKTSYSGTGSVPWDGYGIQSTNNITLTTDFPDVEWCTDTTYSDCLRNDNYILPGTVNSKNYTVMHVTYASGSSKNFATGSISSPSTTLHSTGPYYYVVIPGEYCSDVKLTSCIISNTATTDYPFPAKLRWCSDSGLTNCKAIQDSTYYMARYPTILLSTAHGEIDSTGKITVSNMPKSTSVTVSSIKLNGVEILTSSFSYSSSNNSSSTRNSNLATQILSRIGNGFSATQNNAVLTITTPDSSYNGATLTYTMTYALLAITQDFSGGESASANSYVPGSWQRVDIISGQTYGNIVVNGQTIIDRSQRTDCAAKPNCTYAEELANFANWMAWYRTRMQMMKTATSRAFKTIDNRYRVGFITINSSTSNYLKINTFTAGSGGQKSAWYDKLFNADPGGGTPLRSTLATVGRIFAGKNPLGISGGDDPMQYSCQQNFAILTTDGYWNTDSSSDVKNLSGGTLGNLDSDSTTRPFYEGPTASSGSLADVAKYYYETDIRTSALGNCTGSAGVDVCENNVFVSSTDNNTKQHMTSFTLGLGIDGTLQYTSDYATATSGDYFNIKNGTGTPHDWSVPAADSPTAIDDLWHAAVNGRGVYFSAKDPNQLSYGLNSTLASIGSKLGSGAAAATSTLNPISGDNYAYVASYTTVKWTGNLEARSINLNTGVVSESASWCAESVLAGSCVSPGSVVADTSGSSTIYNCVTPDSTAATCGGTLNGTDCYAEIPVSCNGKMTGMVSANSDTRNIKFNNGGVLADFTYDNLSSAGYSSYFSSAALSNLSQWAVLSSSQQSNAVGSNIVNFLRGQTGYEDRTSNPADNRLFRARDATLGDIVESQPVFVGKPFFHYTDTGYSDFINSNSSRAKTVYVGANDGMLHAFNADNGTERWAYVPSMVIPNMWKLADKNYANMHRYFVNGKPVIADVFDGTNWKTILVAGLNGGARGYYALDVTDPTSPKLLWEINSSDESDIGYNYGPPVITKTNDGTWVALLSSGYNNVSPGTGNGCIFIRNALTGAAFGQQKICTGVGSTTTPSGLAKMANWADYPDTNNTSVYTYAGDLQGNIWRFDINAGTAFQFSVLKDSSGNTQPVTAAPELGLINGKKVIFVGTGKYLETTDLTTTQTQSVYAIKDDNTTTTINNPRTTLVQQVLTTSEATRTGTSNPVDFNTGLGWYIDLPDAGERVHVDLQLDSGTLFVASTVPSSTVCTPGGYGWLNYFNYTTGSNGTTLITSQKYNAPIVGINIFYTPDGKRQVSGVTSDHPTPDKPALDIPQPTSNKSFVGKRLIWREIIQ